MSWENEEAAEEEIKTLKAELGSKISLCERYRLASKTAHDRLKEAQADKALAVDGLVGIMQVINHGEKLGGVKEVYRTAEDLLKKLKPKEVGDGD